MNTFATNLERLERKVPPAAVLGLAGFGIWLSSRWLPSFQFTGQL